MPTNLRWIHIFQRHRFMILVCQDLKCKWFDTTTLSIFRNKVLQSQTLRARCIDIRFKTRDFTISGFFFPRKRQVFLAFAKSALSRFRAGARQPLDSVLLGFGDVKTLGVQGTLSSCIATYPELWTCVWVVWLVGLLLLLLLLYYYCATTALPLLPPLPRALPSPLPLRLILALPVPLPGTGTEGVRIPWQGNISAWCHLAICPLKFRLRQKSSEKKNAWIFQDPTFNETGLRLRAASLDGRCWDT